VVYPFNKAPQPTSFILVRDENAVFKWIPADLYRSHKDLHLIALARVKYVIDDDMIGGPDLNGIQDELPEEIANQIHERVYEPGRELLGLSTGIHLPLTEITVHLHFKPSQHDYLRNDVKGGWAQLRDEAGRVQSWC
jgi:hypothetical protein